MKWRVVEHANEPVEGFAQLKIRSNKKDEEHAGPPNFSKFKLRREQLRSLSWMLEQVNKILYYIIRQGKFYLPTRNYLVSINKLISYRNFPKNVSWRKMLSKFL
jgi:hypothetical protein